MRATEFAEENTKFIEALNDWMNMEEVVNSIDTVLSNELSTPFKRPPSGITKLYRAIVPKDREINSIKASGKIVAFATSMPGALEFIRTLGIEEDETRFIIIEKNFSPQNFVLDFTRLYEKYVDVNMYYIPEHEVWMQNIPYYSKVSKQEIVYDSINQN